MGAVPITQTTQKTFNIRNAGKGSLSGSIQLLIPPPSGGSVFTISPSNFNLMAGATQPETVTFAPDAVKNAAAVIIASNDAARPSIGVLLTGVGSTGRLAVARSFRITATTGQSTQANLTLRNAGRGFLSGSWTAVSVGPYTVSAGSFGPLASGATATIPITFSPTTKGAAPSAALPVEVVGPSTGSTIVTLRGVGK